MSSKTTIFNQDLYRAIIRGPFKGWVPDYPVDELPPDAFSTASNVEALRGRVRKMKGYAAWSGTVTRLTEADGTPATPLALANYEQYDGTVFGVVLSGKRAWKSDGDDWTLLTATTLDGGSEVTWTTMSDLLIWSNGGDAPQKWDGLNDQAALGGSPQICKIVVHWDDRLWLASTTESSTDYPYRLRFSEVGDPEDWTGDNSIDLLSATDPPQFGGITAVMPLGNMLLCYCPNAVWRITKLTASPFYEQDPHLDGIGCVGHNAICAVPEGHFFVGESDIYFWNGASQPIPITAGIHDHLTSRLFPHNYHMVQCEWYREENKILVGISEDGSAITTVYVYDRTERSWSLMEGVNFSCFGYLNKTTEVTWANFPGPGMTATNAAGNNIRWVEPPTLDVGGVDTDNSYAESIVAKTWADFVDNIYERFCGATTDGYVYVMYNANADDTQPGDSRNGAAFTGRVDFGYNDFEHPDKLKRVQRIQPLNLQTGETDNLVLYVGTADNPYQTPTWSSALNFPMDTTTEPWAFCDVTGRYIVFRLETTTADAPWSISGLVVDLVLKGAR